MNAGQCYPTNWVSVSLSPLSSNNATTGSTFSVGYKKKKKQQTLTATQLHHFCFFYYILYHNYFLTTIISSDVKNIISSSAYAIVCLFVCLLIIIKTKLIGVMVYAKKYERSLSTLPKERSCERRASRIATQPCVLTSWCFNREPKKKKGKELI